MSPHDVRIVTVADRPELRSEIQSLAGAAWPEFMMHSAVVDEFWGELYRTFPAFQYALISGSRMLAIGNSIPVCWRGEPGELPDEGVEWALPNGVETQRRGDRATHLCALQIVMDDASRGRGLSGRMVSSMQEIGRSRGLPTLVAPVRPSRKSDYPLLPMTHYVAWTGADGLPYDPWMRVHARLGARTLRVCDRSLVIEGTAAEWRTWTGLEFADSGPYIVPGALVPVEFDLEADCGRYVEPNVWMVHGGA